MNHLRCPLNGNIYYYGNDQLGTPEILTDSTNTVVWEAIYKPFGEAEVNEHSTVINNFRFPGQYYDSETGLHYNYHRYYDPSTGRYLTPDPIGLVGGINLFTYVGNNPSYKTDPLGLQDAGEKCDCPNQTTKTCVGTARFSAIAPDQATSGGALSSFGVNPNSGTVAVSPAVFGLPFPEGINLTAEQISERVQTQKILANAAGQIKIIPTGLNLQGGPMPPFTVGDIGDINIRKSKKPRFDIYGFSSRQNAINFGIQDVQTTIIIPTTMQCPNGFKEEK